MIIAVALSPCVDRTMVVDQLVIGEVHRPSAATVTPGGKGFNVARAAHTLGAPVLTLGIVGGYSGRWLSATLAGLGIPTDLVVGRNETRTSVSIADMSTGVMTDVYEPATPVDPEEWQALEARLDRLISPGDWVSISGTLPTGSPGNAVSRLIATAHRRGAKVAVDTHGGALHDATTARPEVIKINVDEARSLVGDTEAPFDQIVGQLDRTCRLAIVTAGADGAYGGGQHIWSSARGAYPVGSGDSFMAGLLSVLAGRDFDDPEAIRAGLIVAAAAATANALVPGAAVFDRSEVSRLVDSIKMEPYQPRSRVDFA